MAMLVITRWYNHVTIPIRSANLGVHDAAARGGGQSERPRRPRAAAGPMLTQDVHPKNGGLTV
jgi:hypothetical protein